MEILVWIMLPTQTNISKLISAVVKLYNEMSEPATLGEKVTASCRGLSSGLFNINDESGDSSFQKDSPGIDNQRTGPLNKKNPSGSLFSS